MPTYSYVCTECDNRFDAVQAFTEDALTTCPQCSGRLRKLFNSVGVVFKGSGFYRTDSRELAKSPVSSDSGSSSGSEKTGSEKTGSEKTGSDKTGSDKTGTAKPSSDSSTPSSSAPAPAPAPAPASS
ncbi:MAG: FmdB family zinc ribbon protein [Mycobacterium sp.]